MNRRLTSNRHEVLPPVFGQGITLEPERDPWTGLHVDGEVDRTRRRCRRRRRPGLVVPAPAEILDESREALVQPPSVVRVARGDIEPVEELHRGDLRRSPDLDVPDPRAGAGPDDEDERASLAAVIDVDPGPHVCVQIAEQFELVTKRLLGLLGDARRGRLAVPLLDRRAKPSLGESQRTLEIDLVHAMERQEFVDQHEPTRLQACRRHDVLEPPQAVEVQDRFPDVDEREWIANAGLEEVQQVRLASRLPFDLETDGGYRLADELLDLAASGRGRPGECETRQRQDPEPPASHRRAPEDGAQATSHQGGTGRLRGLHQKTCLTRKSRAYD